MRRAIAALLVAALAWPTLEDPAEARGRRGGGYHRSSSHAWSHHRVKKPRRKRSWHRAARWAAVGAGAAGLVAIGAAGAAALAGGTTLLALADHVNVRTRPGRQAPVVDSLDRGEAITVQDTEGGWVQVRTADGRTGWVLADYLSLAGDEAGEARAEAEP